MIYRDLRKGLEDAKNEPEAADLCYGKMEMRRLAGGRGPLTGITCWWLIVLHLPNDWRFQMTLGSGGDEPAWCGILRFFCYGVQPSGWLLDRVERLINTEAATFGTAWPARVDALLDSIREALASDEDLSQILWMTAPDSHVREFLKVVQVRLTPLARLRRGRTLPTRPGARRQQRRASSLATL
jgi:hypothetical protein